MAIAEQTLELPLPPSRLWPRIADTGRLNREAGLPAFQWEPVEGGVARQKVRARYGIFSVEWLEEPFEWRAPEHFSVRRRFLRGPLASLLMRVQLEPTLGGSRVQLSLDLRPRAFWAEPLARYESRSMVKRLAKAMLSLSQEPQAPFHEDTRARQALADSLPEALQPLGSRLFTWLANATDYEVSRIRPFELADTWQEDRRALLEVCLAAVNSGVLELSWSIVCPSCRTGTQAVPDLSDLSQHAECHLCELRFEVSLDQAVEATFRPAPAFRAVPELLFCTGGPAVMPHVLSQANLAAHGSLELQAPADPGKYRVFARGGASARLEVAAQAADAASLQVGATLDPAFIFVAPGAKLQLTDTSGQDRHLKIEHLDWVDRAATVHTLATIPTYRRSFGGSLLRPGISLRMGRVALLFSDLSGSTALYSKVGDAAAFGLVQDHFDLLRQAVEAHKGAVVKTIGDAVMASFTTELDAVSAALAMQRAFDPFARKNAALGPVALKIGVYAGPCYAVTANGMLDYFGQTVNLAARLQGEAEAGEIVIPEALAARAQQAGLLFDFRSRGRYEAILKGIDAPVTVERWILGPRQNAP